MTWQEKKFLNLNTNVKNLNGPLTTLSAVNVETTLTEFQLGDVCSMLYKMTVYKAGHENVIDDGGRS